MKDIIIKNAKGSAIAAAVYFGVRTAVGVGFDMWNKRKAEKDSNVEYAEFTDTSANVQ